MSVSIWRWAGSGSGRTGSMGRKFGEPTANGEPIGGVADAGGWLSPTGTGGEPPKQGTRLPAWMDDQKWPLIKWDVAAAA